MSVPHRQFSRVPDNVNVSLLQNTLVVVIGVGMVGSQIAEGLARFTVGRLRLIDHDMYEMENTLRHALPVEYSKGEWNKAEGMKDYLTKEIEGLSVDAISRRVDDKSISDGLLATWLDDADLVVAATDDRNAQRRIAQQALVSGIPAILPAIYPRRGGGEVIVQLGYEWPCFGCWDYFRDDAEQLRGVRALDLDAQPVIYMAEALCLGLLDPDSGRRDLLRGDRPGDAPYQLIMIDRVGTPSFATLTPRPDCPSCAVGHSPLRQVETEQERSALAPTPTPIWSSIPTHQPGITQEDWRRISLTAGAIALLIGAVMLISNLGSKLPQKSVEISPPYSINVDYKQSLASMISASHLPQGEQDTHVTENEFPVVTGPEKVTVTLVSLLEVKAKVPATSDGSAGEEKLSYNEALASLHRLGYRPATLSELLAFSAQYPPQPNGVTVAELGSLESVGHGEYGYATVLKGYLELRYTGDETFQYIDLLAVRQ
ncbi:MAG TPA: ThiF family adenylyltransferase [Solirubrobacteraceae bacterium]|jgi:molybdopterin/thiamine biosynthesis adenylyltransferase|nr:ThiF family adenylyltransferase [Solirubrobacteraceae bacterium]